MFHQPDFWPKGIAKAGTQRAVERPLSSETDLRYATVESRSVL